MNFNDTCDVFSNKAIPRDPHGVQEVFAVWLSVEPVFPLTLPVMVDPTTQTALLEPSGVVQLASNAFSGVESTGNVSITRPNDYHSYFMCILSLYTHIDSSNCSKVLWFYGGYSGVWCGYNDRQQQCPS